MREEELVGFLIGGLEDGESRQVEAALADPAKGPALRRDLGIAAAGV